ncbi:MAG: hypothetical protein QM750_22135 [Rubrivivax sp.]
MVTLIGGTMNNQTAARAVTQRVCAVALLAVTQLQLASSASAQSVAAAVCPIMVKLLPEVRTFKPEGARAQLVMAVAEKFDYDAATLRKVRAEVDAATAASCPKEREAMLDVLKKKTLAEALS